MKYSIVLLSLLYFAISFTGCGDSDDTNNNNGTLISGIACKGPIKGGTVGVYAIVDGERATFMGAVSTNMTDGTYSIDIGEYTGPVMVEISGGTYTDEATGETVTLDVTLRAAVTNASGEITVAVTPLTEIAVRIAEETGLTSSSINAANNTVAQLLGDDGDLFEIFPVDVTDGSASEASKAQLEYSLLLAGLSQLAETQGTDINTVIGNIAADLIDDSTILDEITGNNLIIALETFLADTQLNQTGINDIDAIPGNLVATIQNFITDIGSFVVPLTEISIDGDSNDWEEIKLFYSIEDIIVKIARDSENTYYAYMSKSSGVTTSDYYEFIMRNEQEKIYSEIHLENNAPDAHYGQEGTGGSEDVSFYEIIIADVLIGIECKFPLSSFEDLTSEDVLNHFVINENLIPLYEQDIKLLPVVSE